MLNASLELFLSEYFLIKAVLGKNLQDEEKLFCALSKIFLIDSDAVKELYALAENEIAMSITTEKDFMQHKRMQQYTMLAGAATKENEKWEEVAVIKGNALTLARHAGLASDTDSSGNAVYTRLSSAVMSGAVSAMRITGILRCEGIFFGKNERAGLKLISKASDWNDTVGTLALLHYRTDERGHGLARLRQEVADAPFEGLYEKAVKTYGAPDKEETGEVKLLNKAFNSGVLKREIYDPKHARVLYGKALYLKDKEKTVFSQNKELLSVIGELPLKLSCKKTAGIELGVTLSKVLKRKAEGANIARALKNSDLRELPSYRPVCLCCNSRYVLNAYASAIAAKSASVHIETIDVAELIDYDFEPNPNNVFVRSIDEDADNRFLLFFCGEISERKMDAAKCILQSGRRARFHLNSPSVTLNLSAVLPVCFCDEQNVRMLKPYCDIIQVSEVSAEEFSAAVEDIILTKQTVYGVGNISLNKDAKEALKGYGVDTAERLIDAAVRARREVGAEIILTREILKNYLSEENEPKIGFGGSVNERYQ